MINNYLNKRLFFNDGLKPNPSWFDYIIIFSLSTILILLTISKGELVGPDTYAHVMTGVLISDYLKDFAFLKSLNYSWNYIWNYYAHYSVLGLLHWPPLFHIIEGFFFLVAPVSEVSARLLVYLFAIAGIVIYFKLICFLFDKYTSLLSTIILVTSPLFLLHSRVASLEVPSLSLSLCAIYYFYKYIELNKLNYCIYSAIWLSMALLCKQTTIVIFIFIIIYYIYLIINNNIKLNYKHISLFALIVFLLAGPYYIIAFLYHGGTIMKDVLQGTVFENQYLSLGFYLYYLLSLTDQISVMSVLLLIAFIINKIINTKEFNNPSINFLLIWLVSCFLFFTFIAQKDNRYIIYWIPPLAGLVGFTFLYFIKMIITKVQIRKTAIIVYLSIFLISIFNIIFSLKAEQPYIQGFDPVAKYVLANTPADQKEIILYDGYDYGQIAFAFRKNDPDRRILIFRTSKFLFASAMFTKYNLWKVRNTQEEINKFLTQYGIRYIIFSYFKPEDSSVDMLRNIVYNDNNFILLKKFLIISKNRGIDSGEIEIYFNKSIVPLKKDKEIEIPMPNLNRTIKIKLLIED